MKIGFSASINVTPFNDYVISFTLSNVKWIAFSGSSSGSSSSRFILALSAITCGAFAQDSKMQDTGMSMMNHGNTTPLFICTDTPSKSPLDCPKDFHPEKE
jgi:hypothetical protein